MAMSKRSKLLRSQIESWSITLNDGGYFGSFLGSTRASRRGRDASLGRGRIFRSAVRIPVGTR
jgi:hypothetical protein